MSIKGESVASTEVGSVTSVRMSQQCHVRQESQQCYLKEDVSTELIR